MAKLTKKEVEEAILRARVRLLLDMPFFGTLATRLIIKDGSGWISTAATDGKHLYYNIDFFSSLDLKELEFVIGHEVLHCVYDHMGRRDGRDPRLWNCAGDYVINMDLKDHRVGRIPSNIGILLDEKYRGKYSEEIYEMLLEEQKNGKGDENQNSFDVHLDPDNGDASGGGKDGDEEGKRPGGQQEDPNGYNGPVPMTEDERRRLKDEIKQATTEAAKVAKSAGDVPAGIRRMIEDLTDPQMNWREIIQTHVQSSFKSDFTWQVPSRKSQMTGCYLPSMLPDERLDVDICLDTSGSISQRMLRDFLSEVKGIMEQYQEFMLRLWTFDTDVYGLAEFTQGNIDELLDYYPHGGGGTNFMVNWDFMKEEGIEPHVFVVMTDGYPCGSWGDENYCDTIFLIHGNDNIVAPFGTTVYYESDEAYSDGW